MIFISLLFTVKLACGKAMIFNIDFHNAHPPGSTGVRGNDYH